MYDTDLYFSNFIRKLTAKTLLLLQNREYGVVQTFSKLKVKTVAICGTVFHKNTVYAKMNI